MSKGSPVSFSTLPELISAYEAAFPEWTISRLADTGGLCIKLEKDHRQILVPVENERGLLCCESPSDVLKRYSA